MANIVLGPKGTIFYDRSGLANTIFGDSGGPLAGPVGGDDKIFGLAGDDTVFGDALAIDGATRAGGNDVLNGGAGDDALFGDAYALSNGARGGVDILVQGLGTGELIGDAFTLESGAIGGSDLLRGGGALLGDGASLDDAFGGSDTLSAKLASSATRLFGEGVNLLGSSVGARDIMEGSAYDDTISGDALFLFDESRGGGDVINGLGGNDRIFGDANSLSGSAQGGDDNIRGGGGDDAIYGDGLNLSSGTSGGDDIIRGGAGNDLLVGDALVALGTGGDDSFRFDGSFGDDSVADFDGEADELVFEGFDSGDYSAVVGTDTVVTIAGGGSVTLVGFTDALVEGDNLIFA